jgi:hypothetical protein
VRRVPEPVGVRGGGHPLVLTGEQRLRPPLLRERRHAHRLDPLGERLVGPSALLPRGGVGEPRGGTDENQPLDEAGQRERRVERDPATHRVPHDGARLPRQRADVRRTGGERGGPPLGCLAVPREVGRQRAIASAERRDRPPPALPRLREPVQEDEPVRHFAARS